MKNVIEINETLTAEIEALEEITQALRMEQTPKVIDALSRDGVNIFNHIKELAHQLKAVRS